MVDLNTYYDQSLPPSLWTPEEEPEGFAALAVQQPDEVVEPEPEVEPEPDIEPEPEPEVDDEPEDDDA